MINSLPTAGTLLAAVKRRSLQVEYEAVVVVGVATVDSLHVSRRLLVVDGHGGVWREQPVPADLAVLRWVSLYRLHQEGHGRLQAGLSNEGRSVWSRLQRGFHTPAGQLPGVLYEPDSEHAGKVAVQQLDVHLVLRVVVGDCHTDAQQVFILLDCEMRIIYSLLFR